MSYQNISKCSNVNNNKMEKEKNDDPISKFIFTKLPEKFRVFPVLFGAVLIHLSLGTYHTFGNMVPYMASYMKNRTNPEIELDQLLWIPMFQGCFPFAMIIGGFLSSHFGPRFGALIGCAFMSGGVFLSTFTIKYSLVLFMLTYGVMFGAGQGVAYVIAVSTVINWAPKRVGLFSGLVAGAFGISAAIFTPIQTALINPENFGPNSDGYFTQPQLLDRVPNIFLWSSTVYVIMQIIGLIFICDPPKAKIFPLKNTVISNKRLRRCFSDTALIDRDIKWHESLPPKKKLSVNNFANAQAASLRRRTQNPRKISKLFEKEILTETDVEYSSDTSSVTDSDNDALLDAIEHADYGPKIVLKSWTFYTLSITLFCCSFYGNLYYNLYKTFANHFIDDDMFIAAAFSTGTIANAIARIGWGIIADKFSFQLALTAATSLASILLFTMPLTPLGGKPMYMIWLILMFICVAANQSLFITAVVKCFGTKHKSMNYGCLIFSTTISGILLSAICQTMLSKIGYTWMFFIAGCFAIIALISSSITRFTKHGRCISIQKRAIKKQLQYFSKNLELIHQNKTIKKENGQLLAAT